MWIVLLLLIFSMFNSRAFVLKSNSVFNSCRRSFRVEHGKTLFGELENHVYNDLKRLPALSLNPRIVLAVSGGVDSVAMLHLFNALRQRHSMHLEVVNFNHKLRQESYEEAKFVEGICKTYNIPFRCIEANENQFSKANQDAFRNWRRSYYEDIVAAYGDNNTFVATAHTQNDDVETIVMKLLRGSHISNIKGMDVVNGFYLKPLLRCTKEQLIQYANSHGSGWREDNSNADTKYKRNLIRLETIPALEKACRGGEGDLQKRLHNLAVQSSHLNDWLHREVAGLMPYVDVYQYPTDQYPLLLDFRRVTADKEHLLFNPLVMGHMVHQWLVNQTGEYVTYEVTRRTAELFAEASDPAAASSKTASRNCKVSVSTRYDVAVLNRQLRLVVKDQQHQQEGPKELLLLVSAAGDSGNVRVVHPPFVNVSQSYDDEGGPLDVSADSTADSTPGSSYISIPASVLTNAAAAGDVVRLRFPLEGDVFQPATKGSLQPLNSFLRSEGVPFCWRDRVLLVTLDKETARKSCVKDKPAVLAVILMDGTVVYSKLCDEPEDRNDLHLKVAWNEVINK